MSRHMLQTRIARRRAPAFRQAMLAGASAILFSAPAFAQQASAPQAAEPDTSAIVVTASRIARDGYTLSLIHI